MIVQAIRSLVFYALFLGQTALLAIPVGLLSLAAPKLVPWWIVEYWVHSTLFMLRWVVGIRTEISGAENFPDTGCIVAAKHQSDWDVFALLTLTSNPAFIAKKELLNIPFFGWAARRFETISLDRARRGEALPQLIAGARDALTRDCQVIIYPEGTRRPPLAEPDYRWGTAKLYDALKVPVVPVAVCSGFYWPRNALVLWPGTARARIMQPIEAGLSMQDSHARLVETIESATNEMILEDFEKGISAPISPEMRARIEALKSG